MSLPREESPPTRSYESGVLRGSTQVDESGSASADGSSMQSSEPENATRVMTHRFKRVLFLCCSAVFFVLGVLGALLPILPATPFLLLTSYFLVRSSPRLNALLLRSRVFGPILKDWQIHHGVRRDIKLKAIVVVTIAVSLSLLLSGFNWLPSVVVVLLATIGIVVILRLPTASEP